MPKRRRVRGNYGIKKVRPKDKQIIGISGNNFNAVDRFEQTLYTATFPCTVTGLRWEFSWGASGKTYQNVNWVIVILRQGVISSTFSTAVNNTIYAPEQSVLAWGCCNVTGHATPATGAGTGQPIDMDHGSTKSMRKLMGGDKLVMISNLSETTDPTLRCQGAVQFFLLS